MDSALVAFFNPVNVSGMLCICMKLCMNEVYLRNSLDFNFCQFLWILNHLGELRWYLLTLVLNLVCYFPAIRKLTEKRRNVENKLERRDVTHDYSSFGSQVYAPLTRIGVFLDRGSEQYNVKSQYLSSYQGRCTVRKKG